MSEKPKTSPDKPAPASALAALNDAEWSQVRAEALKIFSSNMALVRAKGSEYVALQALAYSEQFFATCREVREGRMAVPKMVPAFAPSRMVEVVYDNPDAPGQKVTRLEKSDDGAFCPNAPSDYPLNQKNREAWEAAQPERESRGPFGDGGMTRT